MNTYWKTLSRACAKASGARLRPASIAGVVGGNVLLHSAGLLGQRRARGLQEQVPAQLPATGQRASSDNARAPRCSQVRPARSCSHVGGGGRAPRARARGGAGAGCGRTRSDQGTAQRVSSSHACWSLCGWVVSSDALTLAPAPPAHCATRLQNRSLKTGNRAAAVSMHAPAGRAQHRLFNSDACGWRQVRHRLSTARQPPQPGCR